MNSKQTLLKWIYPLIMKATKAKAVILQNRHHIKPNISFYRLNATLINGETLNFDTLKGKKTVIVNTASDCGFTAQYKELQQLYETHKGVSIIGFPANDFKQQEKEDNETIASFCEINFGVRFPLAQKSTVVKSEAQHKVFQWLSDKQLNGWNDQPPVWNFSKYIVDEEGVLTHYFGPTVSPVSEEMLEALR